MNRKRGEGRGKDSGMRGERKEGDFQKFEILTGSMLCSAKSCHIKEGYKSFSGHSEVKTASKAIRFKINIIEHSQVKCEVILAISKLCSVFNSKAFLN